MYTHNVICILHRYICDLCSWLSDQLYTAVFLIVILPHDLEDHRTSVINEQKLLCNCLPQLKL